MRRGGRVGGSDEEGLWSGRGDDKEGRWRGADGEEETGKE